MREFGTDWKKFAYFYEVRRPRARLAYWFMLAVAILPSYLSFSFDPRLNCTDEGECAVWPVYFMRVISSVTLLLFGYALLQNAASGSAIDNETDSIIWWYYDSRQIGPNRTSRIAGRDIKRIEYQDHDSDGMPDWIFIFDQNENYHCGFDAVLLKDMHAWLRIVQDRWPHIEVRKAENMTLKRLVARSRTL